MNTVAPMTTGGTDSLIPGLESWQVYLIIAGAVLLCSVLVIFVIVSSALFVENVILLTFWFSQCADDVAATK